MLLQYLYLLEIPRFTDKSMYPSTFQAGKWAFTLGDKYDIPALQKAGQKCLEDYCRDYIRAWNTLEGLSRTYCISRFRRVWSYEQQGAEHIRRTMLNELVRNRALIIQAQEFDAWLQEDHEFCLAFTRALCEERC